MRMRQKIQVLDRPSVCPAWASVSSNDSNAPRAVRYMSGNTTTDTANTADHHCIVSFTAKCSSTHAPTMRRGPSSMSSR